MYNFEFTRPTDLSVAIDALKGDGAQALGGGQTLIPVLKQRLAAPTMLVDLSGIESLKGIRRMGDMLVIGGGTTHGAVAASGDVAAAIPGLIELASKIGDPQVRNRGTIGGSLANNDPAACYPAAALALGATIETNQREIAAADFFQGLYTTSLEDGEVITAVKFPIPAASTYQKFEQPASRFSLTSIFLAKMGDGSVRVGVTGAGADGVFRHEGLERALSSNFAASAVDGVSVSAEGMSNDLHGTPEYRANLVKVMTKRAVEAIS